MCYFSLAFGALFRLEITLFPFLSTAVVQSYHLWTCEGELQRAPVSY